MSEVRVFNYPSADGVHTIAARERAARGEIRGVVQIVHGVAEYIERYSGFARFLSEHGFLVCGEDHLGHGRTVTDGKFGYFGPKNGWSTLVRDIRRLRELEGKRYPGVPYFILGHSMGSFLTRTYLIDFPGTVTGAILSGTGQESASAVTAGKLVAGVLCALRGPEYVSPLVDQLSLGAYNKKFAPNRTGADWISRDERVVDAYLDDPLCTFKPTVGMFRDMMGGLRYIGKQENVDRMDPSTPVYFFSGDQDPVGSMGEGVKKVYGMFQKAGVEDLELKLYPQGRHEMLNELNRREVYADTLAWLERHLRTP